MRPVLLAAVAVALVAGCAGSSELEQCVQHSVEEGIDAERAEQACEDAVERAR